MNDPVVIPRNVVARMPKALRVELGVENRREEEVVAVTVPAGDAPEAVRMMRLLASSLAPEQKRTRSEERTQTLLSAVTNLARPSDPQAELEIDNALLRKQYLEQHKTLTSGQIREAFGLKTRNPSARRNHSDAHCSQRGSSSPDVDSAANDGSGSRRSCG